MKVELLHLDLASKSSPISEGVVNIRIDSKPCKDINLKTRHTCAMKAPQVATVHDRIKESGQVQPRPSVLFHTNVSTDNPWVTWHYLV
jgi:hypothetical protein